MLSRHMIQSIRGRTSRTFLASWVNQTTEIGSTPALPSAISHRHFATKKKRISIGGDDEDHTVVGQGRKQPPGSKKEGTPLKNMTRPLALPTKHSTKSLPRVAPPQNLEKATSELLNADLGSWYTFRANRSSTDEDQAYVVADSWIQKVEYILRGHSALIQGSMIQGLPYDGKNVSADSLLTSPADIAERAQIMEQLIERIEQEGALYREEENKTRKAVAITELKATQDPKKDDDEEKIDPVPDSLTLDQLGAPPGPTVQMYDLLMDTWAVSSSPQSISKTESLLLKVLDRHTLDGGDKNTNPRTIPSTISFNAIIRSAVNVPYDASDKSTASIMRRDEILNAAFFTFDRMFRCDAVHRNGATYAHLLSVVKRVIPESRTRGNMARAMIHMAGEEGVVDRTVLKALEGNGGGELYNMWLEEEGIMNFKNIPLAMRKNAGWKRSPNGGDVY